jgi:hypothetical protein
LVESLDDFAELVSVFIVTKLKKLSEHLGFPSRTRLAQQLRYWLYRYRVQKTPEGRN